MARILMASVPLAGHVNPGLPIAKLLVSRGHELIWYSGRHFEEAIRSTGAQFAPFVRATEFHDQLISTLYGKIPTYSLLAHAGFYIRNVFYNPMLSYYQDLQELLKTFDADVIVSDEWFTGGIPFSEKGIKPWVIYGNSPLMIFSEDAPPPGSGLLPTEGPYGKNRDRIANAIARVFLSPVQRHINNCRKEAGLEPLKYFSPEQNIRFSALTLKFTTPIFEFPRKHFPEQLRFVGPVLPETRLEKEPDWLEKIKRSDKPIIFITQGSVDIYDIRKLIIPALKALQHEEVKLIVSTGGLNTAGLKAMFPQENIIITTYVPYSLIMPYLSCMITNGGYGGVSTALSFGVPIIIAGNSEDKPEIASRLRYCGAGIDLQTGRPSRASIKKAWNRILHQTAFKEKAMEIMMDFKTHNAVNESVNCIETLIREKSASAETTK